MTIIRGATTIENDCKEEISASVKELLDEIFSVNTLKKEEVSGFLFSLTTDIHSYHPAKSARECGYDFAPLFACIEPEIDGGLKLCIRLMLFTELMENRSVKHIYQKGAKILRKDISEVYNIALDGLKALRLGIDVKDETAVKEMLQTINLKVEYQGGKQHTILDGEDVSTAIRENAVSMVASTISAHPVVREKMVEMQREIAKGTSCVLDGRDIGSVVLPNAKYKFFITADSKVRAMRRYKELLSRGETVDFDKLHAEIIARDKQDSERAFSPLIQAKDAVLIDTSDMDIESVLKAIKAVIQSKI